MNKKREAEQESLRKRAEDVLASGKVQQIKQFDDIKNYIHELQVYQTELEMQADELRRAQAELEASRDEYSTLYNLAPVGYLSINTTGMILRVNETFARMLGTHQENLLRKPLSNFIHRDDHALFFAVCNKALGSKQFRSCELQFQTINYRTIHGRLDVIPVEDEQLNEPYYRISVVDITDKKKADQEKMLLQEEVLKSQKEEGLKRLAGGIAHNFNNLLTVVIGNLELLGDSPDVLGDDARKLEIAHQASMRSAELSSMMLSYLGQDPSNKRALDLVETVDDLLSIYRQTIHGLLELSFAPAPGPVVIKGDTGQIAQVLNNLVTNAVEAIGEKSGSIHVTVYQTVLTTKDAPVCINGEQPKAGEYCCLEIHDTGGGMSEETLEKAIDPFFTTHFTGRGLGLSAAWGIIQSHGGYLCIESEVDKGTTVLVLLPTYHHPIIKKKKVTLDADTFRFEDLTFLYADDDAIVRSIGKTVLEEAGGKVIEASGGREAVDIFAKYKDKIDCIVIDFAMPDLDGNLALAELRELRPDIPVLLVSGYLKHHTINLFVNEKPDDFLQKPFSRQSFLQAVNRII